jgi:hypothetical protein
MTSLTSGNISKLNKMNRAAQDAALGTKLNVLCSASATQNAFLGFSGSLTVSAGEMNASRVVISSGLSAITEGKWIIFGSRSGSIITNQLKATAGSAAGTIIVSSGSGFKGVTTGDTLSYMGFA